MKRGGRGRDEMQNAFTHWYDCRLQDVQLKFVQIRYAAGVAGRREGVIRSFDSLTAAASSAPSRHVTEESSAPRSNQIKTPAGFFFGRPRIVHPAPKTPTPHTPFILSFSRMKKATAIYIKAFFLLQITAQFCLLQYQYHQLFINGHSRLAPYCSMFSF